MSEHGEKVRAALRFLPSHYGHTLLDGALESLGALESALAAARGQLADERAGHEATARELAAEREEAGRLRAAAMSAVERFEAEAGAGFPKPERTPSLSWAMWSDLLKGLGVTPKERAPLTPEQQPPPPGEEARCICDHKRLSCEEAACDCQHPDCHRPAPRAP